MPASDLWIDVVGCDEDTYDPNSPTAIELRIYVAEFDPDEEALRPPEDGWDYALWDNPRARRIWRVKTWPYTLFPSEQDEGDLRLFWIWRRKFFKWIKAVHLPRQTDWYTELQGFNPEEITKYNLTNMLQIGGFSTLIPVVVTDYSKAMNSASSSNTLTYVLKETTPL